MKGLGEINVADPRSAADASRARARDRGLRDARAPYAKLAAVCDPEARALRDVAAPRVRAPKGEASANAKPAAKASAKAMAPARAIAPARPGAGQASTGAFRPDPRASSTTNGRWVCGDCSPTAVPVA